MTEPVWGQLSKAQDDNETIEEAIVRLIAVHEADAGAHTGAGEALETHKAQDVIDHPADSIVPDKFSQKEAVLQTLFETLDPWTTQGTINNGLGLMAVIVFGDGAADKYSYNEDLGFSMDDDDYTILNNIWQVDFDYGDNFNVADFIFGLGVTDSFTPSNLCLCWKIINGVLSSGYGNDSTVSWVSHGAIAENVRHTIRIQTEKTEQEAYFFLDDVLVRTVDLSEPDEPYFVNWGVYADKVGGTTNSQFASLEFYYLLWANERK